MQEEEEEEEETGLESNTLDEASVTLPSDDGDDQFETVQQVNFYIFCHFHAPFNTQKYDLLDVVVREFQEVFHRVDVVGNE